MGNKINIAFDLDGAADASQEEYFGFDERYQVVGATYTDKVGLTAAAANYRSFYIQNGAGTKTYWQYQTKTSEQGAIAAATTVDFVESADIADAIHEAGASVRLYTDHDGTRRAMDGVLVVSLVQARLF